MQDGLRGIVADVSVLLLLSACSGEPTAPTPAIAVSLSAGSAAVSQGQQAIVTVLLMRTNFDKTVTLAADGLPAGVSASFSPATLTGAVNSSVLTLSAEGWATPTSATNVTVRATGEGVTETTIALGLSVGITGSFTLELARSSLTVAEGGAA